MTSKTVRCAMAVLGWMACSAPVLWAENITLTTYYPAPFGSYDRLKLVPRDSLPADPNCNDAEDVGILYYDNGKGEQPEGVYVCQQTGKDSMNKAEYDWILVSRPMKEEPAKIRNYKVVCVKPDGKWGVCANNPSMDGTCACY